MKNIKLNALLNVTKTILLVVFPLITFPYISRVLGAVNLGKINYVSSIVSYFSLVAALGIHTYAIREGSPIRNDKTKRNIFFNEIFTINLLTTALAFILLLICLVVFSRLKDYYALFIIQSIGLFFNWLGCEWIYSIYEDYVMITIRALLVNIISLVLMFVFVKSPEDYIVYSFITLIASGGALLLNYVFIGKYYRPRIVKKLNFKKHIVPMLFLAVNAFAITIYVSADTTMIGLYLGDYQVGLYSISVKVYTLIKQVMNAIFTVGVARTANYYYNNRVAYNKLLKNILKAVILLSLPCTIGIFSISSDVIALFAGKEYESASVSLAILSFAIPMACFSGVCMTCNLLVKKKEKLVLLITTISAVVNVVLNIWAIPKLGINGAAITTLIAEAIICISFGLISKAYRCFESEWKTYLFALLGCMLIYFVCFVFKMIDNLILRVVLSIVLSAIVYFATLLLSKDKMILNEIKKVLRI